jgi:hypothetical protein
VSRKGSKKQEENLQYERERMHRRYDLAKWTVAPLVWIVSTYAPLKALSGHKTSLTFTFTFTIAVSIITSAGLVVTYIRARKAEKEGDRLRITINELEASRNEVTA